MTPEKLVPAGEKEVGEAKPLKGVKGIEDVTAFPGKEPAPNTKVGEKVNPHHLLGAYGHAHKKRVKDGHTFKCSGHKDSAGKCYEE